MQAFLIVAGSTIPVIITVIITAVRLEHRITKVETNLSWVMNSINNHIGCDKSKNESED